MNDDQILELKKKIEAGRVYWRSGGSIDLCVGVCLNWIETYFDGTKADTAEPVATFTNGDVVALWLCEPSEFVHLTPCFSQSIEKVSN